MVDTVGGLLRGSTSKNRPSHHTIRVSLQSDFCESHTWRLVSSKALRDLMPSGLFLYPIFENEKSNGSAQKSHKKSNRTI